jgi:integrase
MARVTINDKKLQSLAKQAKGWPNSRKLIVSDALVPGAVASIRGSTGHISLGMVTRFPLHPTHPTFRKWGDYTGPASLTLWRDGIREWISLIAKGTDPRIEQARERAVAQRAQVNTFQALWESYYDAAGQMLAHASECRHAGEAFVRAWGARPAGEIEPVEIAALIRAMAKGTKGASARNALGHLSRVYSWAIGSGGFGLSVNPCRSLVPKDLVGKKEARNRVLADPELRAIWEALETIGHPYRPLGRVLIMTGQRLREIADLRWREIDLGEGLITIEAARMKMDVAHVVAPGPKTMALLASLPRGKGGDFVFSTTNGAKPINGFSNFKTRLDALCGVEDWVLHDLRRTARTHFSALPVQDHIRELVIAHARPGIKGTYDRFDYLNEKRDCLRLWEARLSGILAPPPPADVTDLEAERERRHALTSTLWSTGTPSR